jgi:hypothetical protein
MNAARASRACLAGFAGFALVILPASLAEATYGPRTTIGTNYQQTSTTTSANGSNPASCNGFSNCFILFQPAPAQRALIVQHVSCRVSVDAGNMSFGLLWIRKGPDLPLKRIPLLPVPTAGATWIVNSPVMHLIESGERPLVFLAGTAAAAWSAECTISGQLQQP